MTTNPLQVVPEGWDAQYRRMKRSHAKLAKHVAPGDYNSEHYDDDLFHFFQDALHLGDWIKNDPAAAAKAPSIETDLKTFPFKILDGLANGFKHRELTFNRHIQLGAKVTEKQRIVNLGGDPPENRWHVTLADGTKTTAEQVVTDVIAAWDVLLKRYGLI